MCISGSQTHPQNTDLTFFYPPFSYTSFNQDNKKSLSKKTREVVCNCRIVILYQLHHFHQQTKVIVSPSKLQTCFFLLLCILTSCNKLPEQAVLPCSTHRLHAVATGCYWFSFLCKQSREGCLPSENTLICSVGAVSLLNSVHELDFFSF